MRLAAIDIGSNSIHMVIADVTADGGIIVVERAKEMVRLARGVFTDGRISHESMDLGIRALRTFARLARARRAQRLRAVATSAVREARNGADFIRRAREETGIRAKIISGREEARLIYRAASHSLELHGSPYLLIDIGGGSVELVFVREGRPVWLESLPLGVARLTEQFLGTDPPTPKQRRRLKSRVAEELGHRLADVREAGTTLAVGTSGTIQTVLAMVRAARGDEVGRLHGAVASTKEISALRREVLAHNAAARLDLPGMDAKRVDLMPAAVLLVDSILRRAGVTELLGCTWALREGILLDLAGVPIASFTENTAVRRRSVDALATRFAGENSHGRQTARLALRLFDATAGALRLPAESRELLEYAALLHDIGRAIDHERHHRHSAYLIRHAELLDFDAEEVDVIAQVAQGHRKQTPKRSDPEFQALPRATRRVVRMLAALLRLADALDRTHFGVIKDLSCKLSGRRLGIDIYTNGDTAELEMWAAERRVEALARLLERPVLLRARPGRALGVTSRVHVAG
jgi:exopolyphosphatase/guanosine-5'-triphosphate,3'-diphosphate pyrophosphatase